MLEVIFGKTVTNFRICNVSGSELKNVFCVKLGLHEDDIYLVQNGKLLRSGPVLENVPVHVIPKVLGGKGGFGSMLRAIGAQIEKTTNREACRDLSGRRLRDINEEKRLKTWIAQQVEREKETVERKQKKLEKLCEPPRHEFKDELYEQERSDLPEKVEDAITQGLKASCSGQSGVKRKKSTKAKPKKKPHLWVDADVDDISTSNSDESDEEKIKEAVGASSSSASDSTNNETLITVTEKSLDKHTSGSELKLS